MTQRLAAAAAALLLLAAAPGSGVAADWPMWRGDPERRGESAEELAEKLHLRWVLELPLPEPAWPSNQEKLLYDRLYEPVLAGKRLFIASMVSDKVSAYDTESGRELWSFYTGGPVRLAPVVWEGTVYAASDDGFLYALDARDGAVEWKFRGGPSSRRVLGNERLISAWPARGGPVVADGTVYFAASIWPFMGTFIHALDARTGGVVWTQSGNGSDYTVQQHASPAFAGVAPQGYLAVSGERLLVAGGRTVPAALDRRTGKLLHFNVSSRAMGSKGGGGFEVVASGNCILNRGSMYRIDNGEFVAGVEALIVTANAIIGTDADGLVAYKTGWEEIEVKDRSGKTTKKIVAKKVWSTPLEEKVERAFIKSGSRLYASGEGGKVLAIDLPRLDRGAQVSWSAKLPDLPLNMITGDGKLFVSSDEGRLYCFGSEPGGAPMPQGGTIEIVARGAAWNYLEDGSDPPDAWRELAFDDERWRSGTAPLGYGNKDEATELAFGPDAKKKPITCYFRREISIPAGVRLVSPVVKLLADDGAVIYLDGDEVGRWNLPAGEVRRDTLAPDSIEATRFIDLPLAGTVLHPGSHVLAVEIHQARPDSSDLAFDLELRARRVGTEHRLTAAQDDWTRLASRVLADSGARDGYAVVLGIGTGRLVDELVAQSRLHVIAIDSDARRVGELRRRLDRAGVYGLRAAAFTPEALELDLPPYFAELITSEGRPADAFTGTAAVATLFQRLRPFSGAVCLETSDSDHEWLAAQVAAAELDGGVLEHRSGVTLLRRVEAPAGAADWTHQHGDASNSGVSMDRLVKLPLGLLWFGGPSHEGILPRHGHGPTPQVAGGRLIIEGRHFLRAVDVYTGRLLWEKALRDVGKSYDYESHEPGANAIGSNYVSLRDGVYVVHGRRCLRLDPATGETLAEIRLPAEPGESEPAEWGYVGAWKSILFAGALPTQFGAPDFTVQEVKTLTADQLKSVLGAVASWKGFEAPVRGKDDDDAAHATACLNRLLLDADMVARVPLRVRYKSDVEALEADLDKHLAERGGSSHVERRALELKRKLLHKYYAVPDYQARAAGKSGSLVRTASRRLVAMDRLTGNLLWEWEAKHAVRHNAVALGGGKVFCIDRLPDEEAAYLRRRGLPSRDEPTLNGLDIQSGRQLWQTTKRVFGTWVGYSEEHDVVLQAGSSARDRLADEPGKGMVAYRGASGEVLWENDDKYGGPCLLLGRQVITQSQSEPGFALDLLTGARRTTKHPLSGAVVPWQYTRNYGCNTAVGAPGLLTFRSAAAGYSDLTDDSGTGNFGGFRSGCTSSLIPANGVLNAPDYTRACTCSYQNQASLALVHMGELETWTFSAIKADGRALQRLGLNFGAPGNRRAPDGVLWLDHPSVGGPSPDPEVELFIHEPRFVRRHSSALAESELPWVGASALEGSGEIVIELVPATDVVSANLVLGRSPLRAVSGAASLTVPSPNLTPNGERNRWSLRRAAGSGKLVATVAGYEDLAARSISVEFWAKLDADVHVVDARGGRADAQQGFVIDRRRPRVRYFVANRNSDKSEPVVTIESKDEIAAGKWGHVAFTYDAPTGMGLLYLDGKEVGRNDGPDGRALWWESRAPDYVLLTDAANDKSYIDELRIADTALLPSELLNAADPSTADSRVVGYWRMDPSGPAPHEARYYSMRLVFAEIDGWQPGERVFDVLVQGKPVLTSFDIAKEAGGLCRTVVREVHNIAVRDYLRIELAPRGKGLPLLNGVEIIAKSRSF